MDTVLSQPFRARRGAPFAALLLIALAVALAAAAAGPGPRVAGLGNDSALRLVTVRDLLAGQGWFDATQYRLGLAGGFEMHWSRLVDAPLAGLVLLFEPVLGRDGAEEAMLIVWPLLMLAAAVALAWRLGARLAGFEGGLGAAAVAALGLSKTDRFQPGAIDHHNLQIVLLLAVVLGVLAPRPRGALAGGAALAASLAVGVETLPLLALAALALAALWVHHGAARRGHALAFAAGLGGGLVLLFPATVPASAWAGGYCDALSRDLAGPVLLAAGALAGAAALLSDVRWHLRLAALVGAALAIGGIAAAAFPACLANPLDRLAPELHTLWLAYVTEAHSLGDILAGVIEPVYLAWYLPGLAALGVSAWVAWRRQSAAWTVVAALLGLAFALAAYQVRGANALSALATVPLGALAGTLIARWRQAGSRTAALGAMAAVLAGLPAVWSAALTLPERVAARPGVTATTEDRAANRLACFTEGALAPLAAEPVGVVSAGGNLGAQLLVHTPHRVLSAPYHRNQAGMLAQLEIALAPDAAAAEAALRAHEVDYVAVCPADPEYAALAGQGHAGFARRLEEGEVPAFLRRLEAPGAMAIYRVARDRPASG